MTVFRTCKNCVREKEPCERRDGLRASLAGLGVTSVKHACKLREPLFAVGQRVTVTWPVVLDEEWIREANEETWPATVLKESGSRFLIQVDDTASNHETPAKEYVKNPSLFARTTAARLRPLDEPARDVCPACHRVGAGGFGEGGCYGYDAKAGGGFAHRPRGCAALSSEVQPGSPSNASASIPATDDHNSILQILNLPQAPEEAGRP